MKIRQHSYVFSWDIGHRLTAHLARLSIHNRLQIRQCTIPARQIPLLIINDQYLSYLQYDPQAIAFKTTH